MALQVRNGMFGSNDRLVIFDADGTLINAFAAVETAFARHDMDIGDLERFQKRRKLFKYLGGLREFPKNLRRQFGKQSRKRLIETLTDVYRHEAVLYPGMAQVLKQLIAEPGIRVGIVTRNISNDPAQTLQQLLQRHEVDTAQLDFVSCLALTDDKLPEFRKLRARFDINPARSYVCGDEYRDYMSAIGAGMTPFIASYGFEDHRRLREEFNVPEEVLARSPHELCARLCHALGVGQEPRLDQA